MIELAATLSDMAQNITGTNTDSVYTVDTISIFAVESDLRRLRLLAARAYRYSPVRGDMPEVVDYFTDAASAALTAGQRNEAIDLLQNIAIAQGDNDPSRPPKTSAGRLISHIRTAQSDTDKDIGRLHRDISEHRKSGGDRRAAAQGEKEVAELLVKAGAFGGAAVAMKRGSDDLKAVGDEYGALIYGSHAKVLEGAQTAVMAHEMGMLAAQLPGLDVKGHGI